MTTDDPQDAHAVSITEAAFRIVATMAIDDGDDAGYDLLMDVFEQHGVGVVPTLWLIWARMIICGLRSGGGTLDALGFPSTDEGLEFAVARAVIALADTLTPASMAEIGARFAAIHTVGDWEIILIISCVLAGYAAHYEPPSVNNIS